jgi:hypothetical protein
MDIKFNERMADEAIAKQKAQGTCDLGNGEYDHDWRWIQDWGGDAEVIGGTFDCSRWECRRCGLEDVNKEPPAHDVEAP